MTLTELIDKHDLKKSKLAVGIGLSRGCFCNKLRGVNGAKFTPEELDKLRPILNELGVDLVSYLNEH